MLRSQSVVPEGRTTREEAVSSEPGDDTAELSASSGLSRSVTDWLSQSGTSASAGDNEAREAGTAGNGTSRSQGGKCVRPSNPPCFGLRDNKNSSVYLSR
ncbi:MAG: hypothetical protein HC828_11340 [Blastochloris sp.]|nr:hypothetical protein [Blastochloris sp.]